MLAFLLQWPPPLCPPCAPEPIPLLGVAMSYAPAAILALGALGWAAWKRSRG